MARKGNSRKSDVTVRYERDSNGVLMQITEDGVRTHTKFIYDNDSQAGPVSNDVALDATMDAADDDETRSVTPKAESVSEFCFTPDSASFPTFAVLPTPRHPRAESVSTRSSGSLGINHWTRIAPVLPPDPWANGPGSDLATEIVPEDQQVHFLPPSPSAKAMTHMSSSTKPPDSEGHAAPGSAYFPYQQGRTRERNCIRPGIAKRAEAMMLIQRCDAANRNLGVSSIPEDISFKLDSKIDGNKDYASPCPSAQVCPPSMSSRDSTPMETGDESPDARILPAFDIPKWKWYTGLNKESFGDSSSSTDDVAINLQSQSSSSSSDTLADLSGTKVTNVKQINIPIYHDLRASFRLSRLFEREDSPLTEYDYSDPENPRPIRKVKQLPTPKSSPRKGRGNLRTEPIMTRRRAQEQKASLRL